MANKFDTGDGEDADYFVCLELTDPMKFPDNLVSTCSKCRNPIQHRPVYPKGPKKICMTCAMPEIQIQGDSGTLHVQISPNAASDLADYFKKNLN